MERIDEFLPSILMLLLVILGTILASRFFAMFYENAEGREVAWVRENPNKAIWFFRAPVVIILGPAIEELLFRAPIIIAFSSLSLFAWIAIVFSAVVFGAAHYANDHIGAQDYSKEKLISAVSVNDLTEETMRIKVEKKKELRLRKIEQVVISTLLGVATGYVGISFQSIYAAVAVHAAWNGFLFFFFSAIPTFWVWFKSRKA